MTECSNYGETVEISKILFFFFFFRTRYTVHFDC